MYQTPDQTRRARRLRADMTGAEAKFWALVRDRRFEGLKFRRQTQVAGFTVDFYCAELKLVVELDGGVHDLRESEDRARDERLAAFGFVILRFRNSTFEANPTVVFNAIREHRSRVMTQPPHPSGFAGHLLPRGEKEGKA